MANRTKNIIGRVLRNLKRAGFTSSDLTDEDIIDEMNQCTIRLISDANPDKIITVTLVTDQDEYVLSASENSPTKENVASIKAVKQPEDWQYMFRLVDNLKYVDKVNRSLSTSITQPIWGTIISGVLKIFPIPSTDYNGDKLKLYCYLSSSTEDIDIDTEPELPDYWDKAYELFCTSQFLSGDERTQYLSEFITEVNRLKAIPHRKIHTLQAPSIW